MGYGAPKPHSFLTRTIGLCGRTKTSAKSSEVAATEEMQLDEPGRRTRQTDDVDDSDENALCGRKEKYEEIAKTMDVDDSANSDKNTLYETKETPQEIAKMIDIEQVRINQVAFAKIAHAVCLHPEHEWNEQGTTLEYVACPCNAT